ncbi:hypothetical protein TrVFT333_011704 [Trichoderma virens FT-333]|nr:hypothetical protein TrVFT333_011704 [Trichoderma virens FT-333]
MDDETDQQTRQLIINLQLQDVDSLIKGKNRLGDTPPDCEVAALLYKRELRNLATFYSDRSLTLRLSGARLGFRNLPSASGNQNGQHGRQQARPTQNQLLPPILSKVTATRKTVVDKSMTKQLAPP